MSRGWSSSLLVGLAVIGLVIACNPAPPRDGIELPRGTLPRHGTLLLGDLHGSNQTPAFIARLVDTVAAREPVVLGLEIVADSLPSLAAYLASDGSPAARDAMLRDPWWRNPYQDGRASVAMFALIERVRQLRHAGAPIELALFDDHPPDLRSGQQRDDAMARNLLAVRAAHPRAALIVLAGNVHTARTGYTPGYRSMAMQLARAGVAFVTLDARYAAGEIWACVDEHADHCGVGPIRGISNERGIRLEPSPDGKFDGWYGVGPLTSSSPASLLGPPPYVF